MPFRPLSRPPPPAYHARQRSDGSLEWKTNGPVTSARLLPSLPGRARIEYTRVELRDPKQRRAVRAKNMPPSPTVSSEPDYSRSNAMPLPGYALWAAPFDNLHQDYGR